MSGKSVFDFEHKGIGAVIAHNVLRVPPNQREYSWTEREVTGLFEDLGTAINGRWDEYFLGTVVTVARAGFLEVVDGQQRIATTLILLAAIRDRLKAEKDTASVESIERMLTDIDRRQSAHISRLTLNTDDAAFFHAYSGDASH